MNDHKPPTRIERLELNHTLAVTPSQSLHRVIRKSRQWASNLAVSNSVIFWTEKQIFGIPSCVDHRPHDFNYFVIVNSICIEFGHCSPLNNFWHRHILWRDLTLSSSFVNFERLCRVVYVFRYSKRTRSLDHNDSGMTRTEYPNITTFYDILSLRRFYAVPSFIRPFSLLMYLFILNYKRPLEIRFRGPAQDTGLFSYAGCVWRRVEAR